MLSKLIHVATSIGIILIIYFVLLVARTEIVSREMAAETVEEAVIEFSSISRAKGYITPGDYKTLLNKLDSTGYTFQVFMEHSRKIYQPLYDDPYDYSTFQDNYLSAFEGYYTLDILNILFPKNSVESESSYFRFYRMNADDLFIVRVEELGYQEQSSIIKTMSGFAMSPIVKRAGGMVRNES